MCLQQMVSGNASHTALVNVYSKVPMRSLSGKWQATSRAIYFNQSCFLFCLFNLTKGTDLINIYLGPICHSCHFVGQFTALGKNTELHQPPLHCSPSITPNNKCLMHPGGFPWCLAQDNAVSYSSYTLRVLYICRRKGPSAVKHQFNYKV